MSVLFGREGGREGGREFDLRCTARQSSGQLYGCGVCGDINCPCLPAKCPPPPPPPPVVYSLHTPPPPSPSRMPLLHPAHHAAYWVLLPTVEQKYVEHARRCKDLEAQLSASHTRCEALERDLSEARTSALEAQKGYDQVCCVQPVTVSHPSSVAMCRIRALPAIQVEVVLAVELWGFTGCQCQSA
jgi:hypothetical protein